MSGRLRKGLAMLAAAAVLLAAPSCAEAPDAPPPPVPEDLPTLDAALAEGIREALEEIDGDPRDGEARLRLGLLYAANDLNESARRCLEQAIDLGADEPRAWYHLAHARAALGEMGAALAAADRAAELAPDYAPASWQAGLWRLEQGEPDAAEADFRRALDADADASAAALGLARVHLARGEHAEAAAMLEEYVENRQRNRAYALHLLGTAYRALGRLEKAAEALQDGPGGRPQFDDPWRRELAGLTEGYQAELERAKQTAAAGDFDNAIAILEDMRRRRNVTVEVYNNLGLSYLAIDRPDLALEVLRDAVSVNPHSLEAHHLLAGASWLVAGRETGDRRQRLRRAASEHVQRALEINPAYVPALGLRGDILAARGDLYAAIEQYREAARWDEDNPQWMYQVAMAYGRLRQWGDAAAALEQVVEQEPTYEDALGRLGLAYLAGGRLDEAEATLRRALSLNPDHVERIRAALARIEQLRVGGGGAP